MIPVETLTRFRNLSWLTISSSMTHDYMFKQQGTPSNKRDNLTSSGKIVLNSYFHSKTIKIYKTAKKGKRDFFKAFVFAFSFTSYKWKKKQCGDLLLRFKPNIFQEWIVRNFKRTLIEAMLAIKNVGKIKTPL